MKKEAFIPKYQPYAKEKKKEVKKEEPPPVVREKIDEFQVELLKIGNE